MDPRGSAVVAIQPISAFHYTPPHFIKREGTSFGKKGRWNTGKYTWPRHNIFTLHSHALSVLKRHLMQKRQHLLYSIQLVHQTPVLQLFYKLTCNLNIICNYWTNFSFVRWYTYIMHLVSTVSHHLSFLSWHFDCSQSVEPYPIANLTTVPFSHHSPLHSTTVSLPHHSHI